MLGGGNLENGRHLPNPRFYGAIFRADNNNYLAGRDISMTRPSNKRMNLTVWASHPLLALVQPVLRTVARKGRATQPAGYARRWAD